MNISDIVGMTLEDAEKLLHKAGCKINVVKVTSPPRLKSGKYENYYRVIKVNDNGKSDIELLVCKPL